MRQIFVFTAGNPEARQHLADSIQNHIEDEKRFAHFDEQHHAELHTYFAPDGKRRYVSGKTKTEAQRALRKATADRDGGLVFDAGRITLGEYLDRWLSTSVRDTVRRSTYARCERLVRNHIKPSIGRMKLKELTPTHVRSLYRKKLDSGLAPRSVNYIHVTLHKALKQAEHDGLVPRNVSEGVKAPQVHKEDVRPLSPPPRYEHCSQQPAETVWRLCTCSPYTQACGRASC